MSYLAQLKNQNAPPEQLTKPTEPPFVSFGGSPSGAFQKIFLIDEAAKAVGELCAKMDLDPADVERDMRHAAGCDWPEVANDTELALAVARSVVWRRMRDAGTRPSHYTTRAECASCGPVWAPAGYPPRVESCPWCFNRRKGKPIPRPVSVTCGTCRHFERIDHPHLGHCRAGERENAAGNWDTDTRMCGLWEAK